MSSAVAFWLAMATTSQAHEVLPAIADIEVVDDQIRLQIELNAEAILADLDLDGVTDTDAATAGTSYDGLRQLSGADLTASIQQDSAKLTQHINVLSGEAAVNLTLTTITVPDIGDVEVTRVTTLVLMGDLAEGAQTLQVGWPKEFGVLILRQIGVPEPYSGYLEGGALSDAFHIAGGDQDSGWISFLQYIPVGFEHIVPMGLDHILFVLGLFFLSTQMRPLLWQISAFTLAHTVTLAMGALGWIVVPGAIVEPIIAASIVFVAVENILTDGLSRWRPALVFVFGLLHGLGFASVLGEFGLPEANFIPALLGFNVGVEIGQLSVIAAAFLAVGLWFGQKEWYRRVIAIPASLAIAIIGGYWFVERVFL